MGSLNDLFKFPLLTILSTTFAWFSIKYMPSGMIVFWLFVSVVADLITGIIKAWALGQHITSFGFRKTVIKIGAYSGTVVMVIVLVNMVSAVTNQEFAKGQVILDDLLGYLIFIQFTIFLSLVSLNTALFPNLDRGALGSSLKHCFGKHTVSDFIAVISPTNDLGEQEQIASTITVTFKMKIIFCMVVGFKWFI